MKERNYQLDILRCIACLMVILMHTPGPHMGLVNYACVGNNMLTEPCIGLFFMVSGALLLPVKLSYRDFLVRRMSKVLWPTLVFTAFYIIVKLAYGEMVVSDLPRVICSIPFAPQGHGVLWFMYTLTGMYLLAPVITPFLEKASKRELHFVLLLWLISLTLTSLNHYLDVRVDETSTFHSFSGYAGYFVLGYYLQKYPIRLPWYAFPLLIGIPFAAQFVESMLKLGIETFYLSVFCVMQCVAWWQMIMQLAGNQQISNTPPPICGIPSSIYPIAASGYTSSMYSLCDIASGISIRCMPSTDTCKWQ